MIIRASSMMQRRFSLARHASRYRIYAAVSSAAIFFTYIFTTHTLTSNFSTHSPPTNIIRPIHPLVLNNQTLIVQHVTLTSYTIHKPQQTLQLEDDHNIPLPIRKEMINEKFDILKSTTLTRRFKKRAREFFKDHGCKVRFFMTWISSSSSSMKVFGAREFIAVDSLFKSNPDSCLMILSNTMDSSYGFQILKPLTDHGFRVQAITPDLEFLFMNTPAQSWLDHIKNGKRNPGKIPLAQNLSNLIRLAVLYKYGGVYIDTDFVVLKDFSTLRNSIGAQSATRSGNWTRLNNAVLVFDKNHKLLYKFMEEFASTFDGNKWGYNGPYLVSRVVEREAVTLDLNFTVLPPKAFYPVDWTRIGGFFTTPVNEVNRRWVETKMDQLKRLTYGVHLWNKQSYRLRIEEGSIMARLILEYCVICNVK